MVEKGSESITDAKLADRDPLPDIDPGNYDRRTSECSAKGQGVCAEIVVIVFRLNRPIGPECPFETSTDNPTGSRLARFQKLIEHRNRRGIFVASPSRSTLGIYQPSIPAPANPAGRACKPICSCVRSAGNSQYRLIMSYVAFNIGCRGFAFDTDDPNLLYCFPVHCPARLSACIGRASRKGAGTPTRRRLWR